MKKSVKVLIIILVVIILIASLVLGIILIKNKKKHDIQIENEEMIINAEENFKKLFLNLEYSNNKDEAITPAYQLELSEQGKYDVNANVPFLNLDTETAKAVNDEIKDNFSRKLVDIVKNNTVYTIYNVDYITFTNDDILSLVIKATLKEGSNPQRIIVQTYNYDLAQNKVLSFEELLDLKNLDKNSIQTEILNYINGKTVNTQSVENQNYNIYIRDINSEEYLIKNIKNYYIGENGRIYVIFAYGNTNYTETVDVVILN